MSLFGREKLRLWMLPIVAAMIAAPAVSAPMIERDSAQMAAAMAARGINCPAILSIARQPDSARGLIVRISCTNAERTSHWDVRWIQPPGAADDRFEPW